MATPSHSQAVKSLNTTSSSKRRFVFKNFSQRIEEIDIGENVFHSLVPIKAEPSDGSSFLRDCLIEWRELNTAEDFISFYEEMLPWVQTLPQVLLHKDEIMSCLISRLQFKARLSLEPILRLIAALSRDLLKDFLPFLQRITDALVDLLENGAEREPEIVEQIFTSWSFIMVYLKKYLIQDIDLLLKTTAYLRYYHKDYVQEFMAESISFLLRNASDKELTRGIKGIIHEVVNEPSDLRKSGVSAFLWHVMRGTSSRFHSRADRVLRLLMSDHIIGSNAIRGPETVVEVLAATFQRVCEDFHPKELKLLWGCLFDEISNAVDSGNSLLLGRILSILVSTIQFRNGCIISDTQQMLDLVRSLVQKFIAPGNLKADDANNEVVDKVLQLMLCLLDQLVSCSDASAIARVSSEWVTVFELRNKSLLTFTGELITKDPCVSDAFRSHILSVLSYLVEASPSSEEVMFSMMTFFKRLQVTSNCFEGVCKEKVSRMCSFLQEYITSIINDIGHGDLSTMLFDDSKLAVLWAILSCYPHFSVVQANPSLIMDLVRAVDQLPITEVEKVAGVPSRTWESLIGAALASHHKLHLHQNFALARETKTYLDFAQKYKASSQILFAVAEFLDFLYGSPSEVDIHKKFHPELQGERTKKAVHVFASNLCNPDKALRILTLRILSHYEPLDGVLQASDQPAKKKLKTESHMSSFDDTNGNNVVQLLLSIEATPLSVSTSRKVIVLVSQIQMGLSARRFSEVYVPLLLNGIISIFHKRFDHLWGPALECISVLMEKYVGLVWENFISYLEECQLEFLTHGSELGNVNAECSRKSSDLVKCFNAFVTPENDSTPCTTVLSLLLQSLQKVQNIVESRSRRFIPLFFKFLGYSDEHTRDCKVGSFNSHSCKGKEWRAVLKEWLNLLKLMRNPKSLYRSEFLKEVLLKRLLNESDADIQMKVLDCLLNWKDDFLLPYDQHLKNIIIAKNLREELATWIVSKESRHIEDQHRKYLIPVVIRLLAPKVRNLKTLASRKRASVHHRKAILCFLAQLDISELLLFFFLLLKPLQPTSCGNENFSNWFWSSCESSQGVDMLNVVNYFQPDKIMEISWKKRYGFLHVFEDILKSFDEMHVRPFLNLFMGLLVRILESCTMSLDVAKSNQRSEVVNLSSGDASMHGADGEKSIIGTSIKKLKDERSFCLKIVSLVLNKYEDHNFGCAFWDIFFTRVKNLIDGFKLEGSSSEQPSSLFSCFLAMSRSHSLVSLLQREGDLVPSIFSILTVKTASNAIKASVLSFVENLLNLNNDNQKDHAIDRVLLPNLGALINSLHSFYQYHNQTQRKSAKWLGKTELRIFKLIASYIGEPLAASQFVDILLPFLGKRPLNSDDCLEGLCVIQGIVPKLGTEATGKILSAVAPLLTFVGLDIRLSICVLLECLAVNDPSISFLAELIHDLNAVSPSEMDELDFDLSTTAYGKVDHELFSRIKEEHALVILSQSVYDMSSHELSLRINAYNLFLSFIHFSGLVLDFDIKNIQENSEAMVTFEAAPWWTKARIQHIIKKFFMKHMGEAMNKGLSVQKMWIDLLREMVLKLPQIPALNSVKDLCSKDPDVDFFHNILDLQIHKRARALARFRKVIVAGEFKESITKKVFIPLFFKMLFDVQDGKGEHLRTACLESLAAISGHMQWESYLAFLLRCFREITVKHDKHKVLLRLICCILDQFHFQETCMNRGSDDTVSKIPNPDTTLHRCISSGYPSEIQARLQKTVLPKIQKLLNDDSEKINVVVNLATLKLLKLLPVDTLESQLSSIIHRICNFLKDRMESTRDQARLALAACSKELGLEYLQFIVKVLRTNLKRGYEVHVLGFTLHFLLSKALLRDHVTGKIDYCLDELLSVVENDILGDVSEEKEVEKIASKMKETRKQKSFETLKMIAQSVTFKTHALKLLSPVKAHLQKHLTPKLKVKLQTMLNHIAEGITCNPSVEQMDLFKFVYHLIDDGITEETLTGQDLSVAKSSKQCSSIVANKTKSSPWIASYQSQSSHLITVFSLNILRNHLTRMKLDKKDEKLLSMLDPYIKLLNCCLSSKYEDILSVALRCLAPLIRLPLPSLQTHASNITALVLDIAQKSGSTSTPLVDSCIVLLTVLLRSTRITLTSVQLRMLIQFPLFVDLERNPSSVALSLLKAIIGQKMIDTEITEIYDVVTRVGELMVTSQDESIRKKCSKILLQFLLDYRQSENRLQQHLDFLIANLRYEHSTGREAVLDMLHAIIIKFPTRIVDEQSRTFFLSLVSCLVNDQDSKIRAMVGEAIKLLIGRASQNAVDSILGFSLTWYEGENQKLWSAAAQVLGLLVEVLKKGFQRHINNILPLAKNILKSSLMVIRNEQPNYLNEANVQFWKEAYYSLVLLEKVLQQFPELHFESNLEDVWEVVCEFLLYPHMWIRNSSNRLVASYFREASRANSEKLNVETFLLVTPSRLFALAASFCCQLNSQLTDDATYNLITHNIVFAICHVHSLAREQEGMNVKEFWSTLEVHERGHFVKAFQLLGSRKGRVMLASLSDVQINQNNVEGLQSFLVSPLIKRMGKLALQDDAQAKIVFNCFRMISSQIGQEGCKNYALHLLYPLYKVCEGYGGKVFGDGVRQLAEQVRESIQGILGVETFVRLYNEIRKSLKAKREKRRHKEKVMAVVNPERNAKRKLKIAAKHRAHKKRKLMVMKMRW